MSTLKLTPEFQAQLRELAAAGGKSAAKRLVGELGPDLTIYFDDIENFTTPLSAGLFPPPDRPTVG